MTRMHPETARAEARVGELLRGKWRLDRLLGIGGTAAVYAATHRNGLRGAVKILHPELSAQQEACARFLREGYVANRVEHPGVVRVLDDDITEDDAVFLVMELLEGETVEERREGRPGKVLEVDEVLAIADDLLDVLAAAHERGIVHRDLKPENLFLTIKGELKVLDFGIARLHDVPVPNSTTRAGSLMGTPAFMPPEQARGQWERVDARTDIWAVGSTLFKLLSGRNVHQADTLQLLLLAAMTEPAPPVASVLPNLPAMVAGIIDVALAFEPDRRWPNARAMQKAIRQARSSRRAIEAAPHEAAPQAPAEPARQPSMPVPASGPQGTVVTEAITASGTASTVEPDRSRRPPRAGQRVATAVALLSAVATAAAVLLAIVLWSSGDAGDEPAEARAPAAQSAAAIGPAAAPGAEAHPGVVHAAEAHRAGAIPTEPRPTEAFPAGAVVTQPSAMAEPPTGASPGAGASITPSSAPIAPSSTLPTALPPPAAPSASAPSKRPSPPSARPGTGRERPAALAPSARTPQASAPAAAPPSATAPAPATASAPATAPADDPYNRRR